MLAKKLQLKKERLISIMRKIKIVKDKKNDTYTGIILTDPQMRKEVSKPFDGELCGSWRPADYHSPHIQNC